MIMISNNNGLYWDYETFYDRKNDGEENMGNNHCDYKIFIIQ